MDEIERICREMCEERGDDPDKQWGVFAIDGGHRPYPEWERYRPEALRMIQRKRESRENETPCPRRSEQRGRREAGRNGVPDQR